MRRKILFIVGIVILFILVFIGAIFLMLPTDPIRHFAERTIEKQFKYKQGIEIEDISLSPLLNVSVKGLRAMPREIDNTAASFAIDGGTYSGFYCAPYVEEQQFVIDELFVSPKISSALAKKAEGHFEVTLPNGTIDGDVKSVDQTMQILANGASISLNEFALFSNLTKMQVYGELGFDLRAVLEKWNLAELFLKFESQNTAMCPKRFKLNVPGIPFIEMPFTVFGNIVADVEISNNKLIINRLTSDGPDIVLNVTGDVLLKSAKNPESRLNITIDVKPSKSWIEDNGMEVIYQVCEKLDDGGIKLYLKGTTKRLKHDCGTPIPEPVAETEAPETQDAASKADAKVETKEEKPDASKKEDSRNSRALPMRPTHAEKKK